MLLGSTEGRWFQMVRVGGVLLSTMTVLSAVAVLRAMSVQVYLTV